MSVNELEKMPVLKAYLGANGVLTAELRDEKELREVIWKLFRVNVSGELAQIQANITELGKQKRRILVRKNLMDLPARLVSTKRAHSKKRAGIMMRRDRDAAKNLHSPAQEANLELDAEFRAILRS